MAVIKIVRRTISRSVPVRIPTRTGVVTKRIPVKVVVTTRTIKR